LYRADLMLPSNAAQRSDESGSQVLARPTNSSVRGQSH
jgi:hypothetical protein